MTSGAAPDHEGLRYGLLTGVGGVGRGMFFALEGEHTLGRNESRLGRLLDVRDYCKLHIISHYVAVLLKGAVQADGFAVLPICRVGDDSAGRRLREEMAEAGIALLFVGTTAGRPTLLSVCFQYPDGSGGNITTSDSAAATLAEQDIDRVSPLLQRFSGRCIALAVPEVPLAARDHLLRLGRDNGAFCVASVTSAEVPEAFALDLFSRVDLLAVNEDEAAAIAGEVGGHGDTRGLLDGCAGRLIERREGMAIVVSAGRRGAYGYDGGRWDHCPAVEADAVSTAGAGDALLAGVLVGLAVGLPLTCGGAPRKRLSARPLDSALDLGVLLAGLSVTSPHTIHPAADGAALAEFARDHEIRLSPPLEALLAGPDRSQSGPV